MKSFIEKIEDIIYAVAIFIGISIAFCWFLLIGWILVLRDTKEILEK